MPIGDFTIHVHADPPRAIQVLVYSDPRGLRIAASRYDNTRGRYGDTLGVCHRFELRDSDGSQHPLCAIVRLAEPNLGVGVITHEMAHAAVWIRQLDGHTGPLTTANDEDFCWLLGDLVRQTFIHLWDTNEEEEQ